MSALRQLRQNELEKKQTSNMEHVHKAILNQENGKIQWQEIAEKRHWFAVSGQIRKNMVSEGYKMVLKVWMSRVSRYIKHDGSVSKLQNLIQILNVHNAT